LENNSKEKILITGCAGFIGMHLCLSFLKDGYNVFGIDNLNSYYEKKLKYDRLKKLKEHKNFSFEILDIIDFEKLQDIFKKIKPIKVINLAAQAGVQYSLVNPTAYINSNIHGFMNILECCKKFRIDGLIYASSSSVYGGNKKVPFSEIDNVDNPISIYAASKISNELMAKVYNNLYDLNSSGLRFFTVYGAWGRPDMAYYSFTKKILDGEKIEIYNFGKSERDFTYIDDIVIGIRSAVIKNYKCEIFNLGNSHKENILDLVKILENRLGIKAKIEYKPLKIGDVKTTYANISKSYNMLGFTPKTNIETGLDFFLNWYINYYNI